MTDIRSKTFLADWIRRHMPTREQMAKNKYLAPIAHRFLAPELWRFTRRNVPRGIAVGLFAAFIIPLGQILLAAFLSPIARSNVPVSALTTFVTNPFTYPLWVVFANQVGRFVLNIDAAMGGVANDDTRSGLVAWIADFLGLAGVTWFGFFVLAVVSAALGHLIATPIWRYMVARKRRRRIEKRQRAAQT